MRELDNKGIFPTNQLRSPQSLKLQIGMIKNLLFGCHMGMLWPIATIMAKESLILGNGSGLPKVQMKGHGLGVMKTQTGQEFLFLAVAVLCQHLMMLMHIHLVPVGQVKSPNIYDLKES